MRLIDADALKLAIERYLEKILSHRFLPIVKNAVREVGNDMIFAIDVQQTVDAVPVAHGHWRRGKSYPHNIYCSNCYRTYVPNDELEMWKDWTRLPRKYCPECGAQMDEVINE